MEVPHDPKYDDIEPRVEELFRVSDLAIFAIYNRILKQTHKEEVNE